VKTTPGRTITSTMDSLDDTARIILMESPSISFLKFSKLCREAEGKTPIEDLSLVWRKYRGLDGRIAPTHDIETGKPLHLISRSTS
jgi:hypothetical protein